MKPLKSEQRPIDLLRAANKNKIIQLKFSIPLEGEQVLNVILKAPDIYAIWEAQELSKRDAIGLATKRGLDQYPVTDEEWNRYLERFSDPETRKAMDKDRPANQAEKYAIDIAYLRTVRELIPRYLCTTDGEKAFPTQEERDELYEIMCSNPAIMNLLTDRYVELSRMVNEARDAVKNS